MPVWARIGPSATSLPSTYNNVAPSDSPRSPGPLPLKLHAQGVFARAQRRSPRIIASRPFAGDDEARGAEAATMRSIASKSSVLRQARRALRARLTFFEWRSVPAPPTSRARCEQGGRRFWALRDGSKQSRHSPWRLLHFSEDWTEWTPGLPRSSQASNTTMVR